MNKIFKVVWSKTKNCYVVTSELAKNHTKSNQTKAETSAIGRFFNAAFVSKHWSTMTARAVMAALVLTGLTGITFNVSAAQDSVVVESGSVKPSQESTEVGINSIALNPIVGGGTSNGTAANSVAIGTGATTGTSEGAVAIGENAMADTSEGAVAIGENAKADTSKEAIVFGLNATATNSSYSILMGSGAKVTDSGSAIAFGQGVTVSNSKDAVILGRHGSGITNATEDVLLGVDTQADYSYQSIAIGSGASVKGTDKNSTQQAIAIGQGASATSNQAIAIGQGASATSNQTIAIGRQAKASGTNSITIGGTYQGNNSSPSSTGEYSIVIGSGSTSGADGSPSSLVSAPIATVSRAVVIGTGASATGGANDSVVIGGAAQRVNRGPSASNKYSVAIGAGAKVASTPVTGFVGGNGEGTAVGHRTAATSQSAAFGNDAYALGASSIAIGNDDNSAYKRDVTTWDKKIIMVNYTPV